MSGEDVRKDYDQAGCASGCRDTMAWASALLLLVVVALVRLTRRRGGRRG